MRHRIPRISPELAEQLLLAAQSAYFDLVEADGSPLPLVLTLATPWPPEPSRLDRLLQTVHRRVEQAKSPVDSPLIAAALAIVLARHLVGPSEAPRGTELGRAFCRVCRGLQLHSAHVWARIAYLAHYLASRERFDALPTLARLRAAVHARWHDCEARDG